MTKNRQTWVVEKMTTYSDGEVVQGYSCEPTSKTAALAELRFEVRAHRPRAVRVRRFSSTCYGIQMDTGMQVIIELVECKETK